MNPRTRRRALLLACATIAPAPAAFGQEPVSLEAPTVEVIGTTPLPGLGVPVEQVPSNVQAVTDRQIEDRQAINLPDLMTRSLPSVNVNEVTGNPFQADVNYRGFQASPLLGTPQGLSVFQDGVRLNEPFGDVVYWDLIPQQAISAINLIPGSNPVFGLNTLGGALSLRTKTGAHYPNTGVQVYGGSWDRWAVDAEHGGYTDNNKDYYISGSWFEENGWRDFSPSEVGQFFAKIGHEDATSDLDLSFTYGDTDLTGNGVTPESMLKQRREQVFTVPDNTTKEMWMVNLTGSRVLSDRFQLGGNVYYRNNRIRTLNGDANDDYEDCFETSANPAVDCTEFAVNNRTRTEEDSYGAALQLYHLTDRHRLTLGASVDRGESDFSQSAGEGVFDQNRGVIETEAEETDNILEGSTTTWSVYLTDTWNIAPRTHLTLSGRYNHTSVKTTDLLNPTPPNVDADHSYESLNPAIGITHALQGGVVLFGGWSQGTRAPSPIELGCADPNNPCSLPNAMQADPFLEQVTARTWEAGARGRWSDALGWVVSAFHTDTHDDILFLSTGTSAGFFTNFGKTRRQGVELGLTGDLGKWQWFANYSYIRATFESSACLLSENNSSRGQSTQCASDDEILVSSGDQLPGVPEHQLKLGLDYRPTERITLGLDVALLSEQFARGNENNQHQAGTFTDRFGDARTFLGSGEVSSYAIFNLTGRYRFARNWEVFARIDNLFDTEYETAAILAENPFDAAGQFQTDPDDWGRETFFAPGAPRAAWVGVKFAIDRQPRR
jgi:outer membrane receptor protein involved in Fe transport